MGLLRGNKLRQSWHVATAALALTFLLSSCGGASTQASPATLTVTAVKTATTTLVSTIPAVTETETQTETATETETETTVSTLDPVSVSRASVAAASSAAAAKAAAAASKAAASAAAAAKAGPIYYSMNCETGGQYVDFATYQAAWQAKPATTFCDSDPDSGGDQHGAQFTALEAKALALAYGKNADKKSLSTLFGLCGEVNGTYTTSIINGTQANEAAGALLICPNHPNAKKIQANIDSVRSLTGGDPNASVTDVITYAVTGSTSSTSVTYSTQGSSIAQENEVSVPWSKTLTISGEYRFLSLTAQNQEDSGSITCTISVAGKVVDTVTSTGGYAIASCNGS